MVRTVVAPDGRTWKVRRKWLTRTVRWRGADSLDPSLVPNPFGHLPLDPEIGCLPAVGSVVGGFVVVLLVVVFVLPAIAFALELGLVLLLVGLGVLARIVFRRPWTIEARVTGTNEGRQWKVAGWRASGELRDRMAEQLRSSGGIVRFTD